MPEIACLGLLVADTVGATIDRLPTRGTLSLIDRIELHTGGCAANTGAALAVLGVSTAVLGKVGADGFGDFVTESLAKAGVETRGIGRDPQVATAATIVAVHGDAERSFLHVIGANATVTAGDVDWDIAGGAAIFHVAGLQLMPALEGDGIREVLVQAKARGLLTTLDTVMNPRSLGWDGLASALPYLDWALPSFEEARALTGETKALRQARRFQAAGAKNVAVKMGANGCLVAPETGKPFHVAPLAVEAVDSLGAGDAWAAGFLTGLLRGWPLEKTARFANAVGACCVQAYGSTAGIRTFTETLALIGE
ncbi:MAG: sugar kinase [Cytophagales bacterium]|nr:sugar kinase [Armatimonadota bacterium]